MTNEVVLAAPVRTAIGTFGGKLKDVSAVDLGAAVIQEAVKRSGLAAAEVTTAVMGNVIQAGNKMNPARQAAVTGGLPYATTAMTINRVCGSGAQAIATAAAEIALGWHKVAVAGGMENMDRAPYLLGNGRYGYRMGPGQVMDSILTDGLCDAFSDRHSGWHTEDLVKRFELTRQDLDAWAARSQQRFSKASQSGIFDAEVVPLTLKAKSGEEIFQRDETPRPDTTVEVLARLKPAFRADGAITAGNAPGINSGAAAMIVAERGYAESRGLDPFARLVATGVAGVEPGMFGLGAAAAVRVALARAGWTLTDVERFEINEAFAAVALAVIRELSLSAERVNVEGGAVAHGHPIGATGAILTTRLLHSMRRDGLKRGIVALCIGGGQGIALALERL